MPMMTSRPAFTGSALWFLGNPTTAGMHTATLTFTATTPGTYHYLCPVPGHAQEGMAGPSPSADRADQQSAARQESAHRAGRAHVPL